MLLLPLPQTARFIFPRRGGGVENVNETASRVIPISGNHRAERNSWERRRSRALQPFAPAEAGVEVMPEFDVFLVLFPAKKNLFAPHDGGKINQAALQILDENPAALKFGQNLLHVRERANPVVHRDRKSTRLNS